MRRPFRLDELGARFRPLARRLWERVYHVLEAGDARINLDSFAAQVAGRRVEITPRKFALLSTLAARAGRIAHRKILEGLIYGRNSEVSPSALEVLFHAVRRKIGASQITTVRGVGNVMPTRSG